MLRGSEKSALKAQMQEVNEQALRYSPWRPSPTVGLPRAPEGRAPLPSPGVLRAASLSSDTQLSHARRGLQGVVPLGRWGE